MAHFSPHKLPVQQLVILATCRLAEALAASSLDPYLPEMIESFGIPTKEVARWAGMTGACYSICQCLTAVIWGRMSDRLGRKYLLLASTSCAMIASLLIGLSKSLVAFILVKSFAGAGSGSASIIDTMVAEMAPHKDLKPRAFSIMPLVWIVGITLGPLLGALLVQPAKRYPQIFGGGLFQNHPFLLPPLVVSMVFLTGITVAVLFLRETLESKKSRKDHGLRLGDRLLSKCLGQQRGNNKVEESEPFLFEEDVNMYSPSTPILDLYGLRASRDVLWNILLSQSSLNLIVGGLLLMHSQAYDQLLPIIMHHPTQKADSPASRLPLKFAGGFGMSSSQIGLQFTLYGVCSIFTQVFAFPRIAKSFGVLKSMKIVVTLFPIIYLITPFTLLVPTSFGKQAALFLTVFLYGSLCTFAFPCSAIMLAGSASSASVLGTLTGISYGTSAFCGAIGSVIGGTFFTSGGARGYIIDPYCALAVIATVAAIPVFYLMETEELSINIALDDLDVLGSDEETEGGLRTKHQNIKVL